MPTKKCLESGCKKVAQSRGVCFDHGAIPPACSFKGCKENARCKGVCAEHGATKKICSVAGCDTPARRGGVCAKHGATPKICSIADCDNIARKGGICAIHGAKFPICIYPKCTNIVQKNNLCTKHGAQRTLCIILGCTQVAHKDKLCYAHNTDPVWRAQRRATQNKYERERYQTDFHYRISVLLRSRLYQTVSNEYKGSPVLELVGCDIEDLYQHLQAQFDDDMHWGNMGEWHIDHIKPCASFDLTDPEEQKECFHYTNLQPLWGKDNISKGAKLNW